MIWSQEENAVNTVIRSSGAGKAIVGADEEVLCWDVKKGELLGRWKDSDCSAEVTIITQSKEDPDIYAVGYVSRPNYCISETNAKTLAMQMAQFGYGTLE